MKVPEYDPDRDSPDEEDEGEGPVADGDAFEAEEEPDPREARLAALEAESRQSRQEAERYRALYEQRQRDWDAAQEAQRQMSLAYRQQPHEDPSARYREKLEESGIPAEALAAYLDSQLNSRLDQRISETLMPFVQSAQAAFSVDTQVPEFSENRQQIMRFLQENPAERERYERLWKASPEDAARLAVYAWKDTAAMREEQQMRETDRNVKAERTRRKIDATPVRSQSGRQVADQKAQKSAVDAEREALEWGRQSGDMSGYRALRLKDVLDKVKWAED